MIGRTLSHYAILSRLGAGGMGEVFLAEDLVLRRKVAVKILPVALVADATRMERFRREAEAASSLSHPNIVSVHEFGESGDVRFIAMEFVEGETLRARLDRGTLPLDRTLDITAQLLSALIAAHRAGIVHRDIKPSNVMLHPDGYVKLLDFGLAKVTPPGADRASEAATTMAATGVGDVLGTVGYMSPEQARGQTLDARSDLFSLGAVLYETYAGRPAFRGDSPADVLAALLSRDPDPLSADAASPPDLSRIILKALAKDANQRYQRAQDMLIDVQALRDGGRGGGASLESRAEPSPRRMTSTAGRTVALALVGAAAVVTLLWLRGTSGREPNSAVDRALKIVRLTGSGDAVTAAISSDGNYVAYATGDDREQSLWLRQVSVARTIQLVAPAPVRFWSVGFSRSFIYYVTVQAGAAGTGTLRRIPTLGGESRTVAENVSSPVAVSPDGQRLLYLRTGPATQDVALVIASADGGEERVIGSLPPSGFVPEYGPAWSPDGERIAYIDNARGSGEVTASRLVTLRSDGSDRRPLATRDLYFVRQLTWAPDGGALFLVGQDQPSAYAPQIWRVGYPSGDVRQVTSEADNFDTLSLDGTGSTIAAVQRSVRSNIWLSRLGDRQSHRFSSSLGTMEGKAGVTWTSAGRLVYSSFVSGGWVLLSSDADGNNVTQLTFGAGGDQDPIATANATRLLFASNRAGGRSIWVMDVDGGHVRQLTRGFLDWLPFPSPDGRIAYYASVANRRRTIWSAAIDGGTPKELSPFPCDNPTVSPDGRLIACYAGAVGASSGRVAIMPATGGDPVRVLDVPATFDRQVPFLRWLPDGRALAYVDTPNSVSNIRTLPLDAAPAYGLTDFAADRIFKFDISPDGVRVITARGTTTTDVVLLRNFR